MADIKISQLSEAASLEGVYTIGVDKYGLSKKVSLQKVHEVVSEFPNVQQDVEANRAGIGQLSQAMNEVREQVENNEVLIEDLQNTKIDKEADDYYPQLSVGVADNLAGVDEVASEFSFRRSGGGAITDGVARVQSIKGNSVVWNQLAETFASNRVTINSDGSGTISGVSSTEWLRIIYDVTYIIGHKYSIELIAKGNYSSDNYALIGGSHRVAFNVPLLWNSTLDGKQQISARLTADNNGLTYRMRVTDLTQMFGSGNEPNSIAEFYQRIPMGVDLNAFNEGEVISMRADGIKSVGRNQWNEQWELGGINSSDGKDFDATNSIKSGYIRILANTKYYFKKPQGIFTLLYFYDENKSYVGYLDPFVTSGVGGVFTTMDAPYMRFMVAQDTYHHDICLNLSDTDFNGQYEPYIEDFEDLSMVAKYFPNGMRSAGSAYDEIRLNKATQKWEAIKRIGENGQALANSVVTEIAEKYFNLDYKVWNCGTEQMVATEPSAPLAADITYGFNAIGKIKELESLVAALRAKVGI